MIRFPGYCFARQDQTNNSADDFKGRDDHTKNKKKHSQSNSQYNRKIALIMGKEQSANPLKKKIQYHNPKCIAGNERKNFGCFYLYGVIGCQFHVCISS